MPKVGTDLTTVRPGDGFHPSMIRRRGQRNVAAMNDSDVQYAPMTVADYEAVSALWRVTPGLGLGASDAREPIGRYLERNPGSSFVARIAGEVVGAVLCGHDGRRGYLHHLAVAVRCRGRGVGRQPA